jgi:hypothetical protein
MKTHGGRGGIASPFLTSVLDWSKWSASRLCRFVPGTHCIVGWIGPIRALDAVKWEKSVATAENRALGLPSPQPVAISTELYANTNSVQPGFYSKAGLRLMWLDFRFNAVSLRLLKYITSYGKLWSDWQTLFHRLQEHNYRVSGELGVYLFIP